MRAASKPSAEGWSGLRCKSVVSRMLRMLRLAPLAFLAGCAAVSTLPTATVFPSAQTRPVATVNADAADDPAIWAPRPGEEAFFAGRPVEGLIAGTDKKAGLYVYNVAGDVIQFLPDGLFNNVDLREIEIEGRRQVLFGTSDRTPGRMGIAFFRYDPAERSADNELRAWGFVPADVGEPYGFCMGRVGGMVHALLVAKDGEVRQYRLSVANDRLAAEEVRRFAVGSQSEGCAFDDEAGFLYIGEESVGVWRYPIASKMDDASLNCNWPPSGERRSWKLRFMGQSASWQLQSAVRLSNSPVTRQPQTAAWFITLPHSIRPAMFSVS
jgi:myo-inositol-hexaphosphate 3-phosphohydrolase